MKRTSIGITLAALALVAAGAAPSPAAQDLQQKLAAVKQAAAQNQQALRSRTRGSRRPRSCSRARSRPRRWTRAATARTARCRRRPVVEPPPAEKKRGLKGKIVAKKTGEMKEELEADGGARPAVRAAGPGHDPGRDERRHGVARPGRPGPRRLQSFPATSKAGDALTITFDKAITALRQIDVKTWLEKPEEAGHAARDDAVAARRDQLSRQHRADHPGTEARGAHHEVELPEARDVEQ